MQEENKHNCIIENNERASSHKVFWKTWRLGIRQSGKEPGEELPRQREEQQWRPPGGEEVSLFPDPIESQCDYSQDEESDLERNKPAISTANTLANEAAISLKILRFIKNQNKLAKWNWINWHSL